MSKTFSNKAMQAVAFHIFNKCGNCVYRMDCMVNGTLKSGGFPNPVEFIVDNMERGCIEPKHYKGHGLIVRNVAKVLKNECGTCNKFDLCIKNVCDYVKIEEEHRIVKIQQQAHVCANCDRLEDCIQQYMKDFKLHTYTMFLKYFVLKFRNCKDKQLQRTTLDLVDEKGTPKPINISTTVVFPSPSNVEDDSSPQKDD